MPLIDPTDYNPPWWLRNHHVNTFYAGLFRKVEGVHYQRERLELPDGDFVDLDWSRVPGARQLVIVIHGMEGHADRPYVRGMIRQFNRMGWDGIGMNLRGCSGEPNRLLRTYHVGDTADLSEVIQKAAAAHIYKHIVLVGFSLGGNVVMKYAGERGEAVNSLVKAAIGISVPCDVAGSSEVISRWYNRLYVIGFLHTLNPKIEEKARRFPEHYRLPERLPKTFLEFDEWYTAPVHGFSDAKHYWDANGCLQYLPGLRIPALLMNARDDTFLSRASFPGEEARQNPYFYLRAPKNGGHVGFVTFSEHGSYWTDQQAVRFAQQVCSGAPVHF